MSPTIFQYSAPLFDQNNVSTYKYRITITLFLCQIYAALRRRRNVMGPNATAAHQQQLNEDNRQALVLFGIVFIFFFSNVPRILLNLHEVHYSSTHKS